MAKNTDRQSTFRKALEIKHHNQEEVWGKALGYDIITQVSMVGEGMSVPKKGVSSLYRRQKGDVPTRSVWRNSVESREGRETALDGRRGPQTTTCRQQPLEIRGRDSDPHDKHRG